MMPSMQNLTEQQWQLVRAVALAMPVKYSAVSKWKQRGRVPRGWRMDLLAAARELVNALEWDMREPPE